MTELVKATLTAIRPDGASAEIPVQFNPTTLKLTVTNHTSGGASAGNQVRQSTGLSGTSLSLDLVFDTVDEGTTGSPRSVREKTAMVERFVLPPPGKIEAPPMVRFDWGGKLRLEGVVDSVTIDFDHFAADGTPLRAKVGLNIKEQNQKYVYLVATSKQGGGALAPGQASPGALGSSGTNFPDRFAQAVGGESAAQFAARLGLEPAAWRGLSLGASGSLSLEAGVEVGFNANLSVGAGLGVTLGVESGVSASLEASFGLEAGASLGAVAGVGVGADLHAGFALSASGGVSAAVDTVNLVKTQVAEQRVREAFNAPPRLAAASNGVVANGGRAILIGAARAALPAAHTVGGVPVRPMAPAQPRPPLTRTGLPSLAQQENVAPAPALPRADPRAASFGFGVPLRSTVGRATEIRVASLAGSIALRAEIKGGEPPMSDDPTTPPWVSLPRGLRQRAEQAERRRRLTDVCGCTGPCRHKAHKG